MSLVHASLAGLGIVLLLSIVMGNARNLLLVLVNLPFALVGGVLAVFASGGWLSLGAMVGFVTLFGITLRNSIMLISHYEHLIAVEGMAWGLEAAIRGASERLAPILMTALVTALGLLPLAVGSGKGSARVPPCAKGAFQPAPPTLGDLMLLGKTITLFSLYKRLDNRPYRFSVHCAGGSTVGQTTDPRVLPWAGRSARSARNRAHNALHALSHCP